MSRNGSLIGPKPRAGLFWNCGSPLTLMLLVSLALCLTTIQVRHVYENIPAVAVLFPITPDKIVDQRCRRGHSEPATSLMTVQNRMALDPLLAEKGGVCCTFILNNTAPDGSRHKALEGLQIPPEEMVENSGITSHYNDWLTREFCK